MAGAANAVTLLRSVLCAPMVFLCAYVFNHYSLTPCLKRSKHQLIRLLKLILVYGVAHVFIHFLRNIGAHAF